MSDLATVQTPDRLIALAIEHNADVEKLERLMALQERWHAQQARSEYFAALARFQASCPAIQKTKEVKNKDDSVRYRYAPLDAICRALREPLQAHGFSYRWETQTDDEALVVTCHLTHTAGHSESATVRIPGIVGHGTNAAQDTGSAISYGKRYSFSNVLGITVDEDDDGASAGPQSVDRILRHNAVLAENLESVQAIKVGIACNDLSTAAQAWYELDDQTKQALWVAPTKGGIFTTKEREVMKSTEFRQAHFGADA